MLVSMGGTVRPRQRGGNGHMKCEPVSGLPKTVLATGCHDMVIDNWSNGFGRGREGRNVDQSDSVGSWSSDRGRQLDVLLRGRTGRRCGRRLRQHYGGCVCRSRRCQGSRSHGACNGSQRRRYGRDGEEVKVGRSRGVGLLGKGKEDSSKVT